MLYVHMWSQTLNGGGVCARLPATTAVDLCDGFPSVCGTSGSPRRLRRGGLSASRSSTVYRVLLMNHH